jgi:hypothetical protein
MSSFEPVLLVEGSGEEITIHLFTDHAQGLMALSNWIDGFEASGDHGRVPGSFELTMHIREMRSRLESKHRLKKAGLVERSENANVTS